MNATLRLVPPAPAPPEARPGRQTAAPAEPPRSGPSRVLFVGVRADLRAALSPGLPPSDLTPSWVDDAASALHAHAAAWAAGRPFVACVVSVGGVDAADDHPMLPLVRRLRTRDAWLRVIATSTRRSHPIVADAARYGFDTALVMPYDRVALVHAIRPV